MKTYLPKESEIEHKWYVVDATDKVLGRLAVDIANVLRGRHKPSYTPHLDCGDFVVVINADKVKLTGNKETKKTYENYTGWMGGRTVVTADKIRASKPERMIQDAVHGMLPKGRLGRAVIRKMKVYAGSEHPHAAQQPETFPF